LFKSYLFKITCVIATCDDKGCPNTAPINSWIPVDKKKIIVAIWKKSKTINNIMNSENVMIEILWEKDVALGISGNAKIIKESMNCHEDISIIIFFIKSIKLDASPVVKVISGPKIRFRHEKTEKFSLMVRDELLNVASTLRRNEEI